MRGLILPILLALAGCSAAGGVAGGGRAGGAAGWADPSLSVEPPDCVMVMPAEVDASDGVPAAEAEEALARHLSGRVERVVGPARRDAATRRLGLDLGRAGDRERLAAAVDCRHAAVSRVRGGRAWGVVWSETRIGVEVAILDFADGSPRWRGAAVARRGGGGLPVSPVSALLATGLAAQAALDDGVVPSVLDDALRAALSGLPDLRDPQAFASRNSSVSPLSSRK